MAASWVAGLRMRLFPTEDLGTLEKFRPYGVPTKEWLAEVRRAMQDKA